MWMFMVDYSPWLAAESRVCGVDVYGRLLPLVGTVNLVADSRVCDVDVYGRLLPLVGTVNLVADSRVCGVDVYGRLLPPGPVLLSIVNNDIVNLL